MAYNPEQPRGPDGRFIQGGATRDMLSSDQIGAMETYRSEGYAEINEGLRSGALGEGDEIVDQIDSVINTSNPESFDAFRGGDEGLTQAFYESAGLEIGDDPSSMVGMDFVDDGFVSVTTDENVSQNFQRGSVNTDIEIRCENMGYADMEKIFPDDGRPEGERLLPRGTTFRIDAAEFSGNRLYLEVTATREVDG
jgi:hypothetical protein